MRTKTPATSRHLSAITHRLGLTGTALGFILASGIAQPAEVGTDPLQAAFVTPPAVARPRVWWHWVNGNVTEEGIRLDLEWMKRVGIGGVQSVEAAFATPPQVPQPLRWLSPEWVAAMRTTVSLTQALGLEVTLSSSPGWSETGGPWVQPREAMKKLVWSETAIEGGRRFTGRLASPPTTTGLFQDIPLRDPFTPGSEAVTKPTFYADVAVIGYRAPRAEVPPDALKPTITSSSGPLDAARLSDGDLVNPVLVPFGESGSVWIQFAYDQPRRMQAVTAVIDRSYGINPLFEGRESGHIEASTDGQVFRKIADLPNRGAAEQTVSFTPTTARFFRVVLERRGPSPIERAGYVPTPTAHEVAELVLISASRVNQFEDKAGYSTRQILEEEDTPHVAPEDAIRRGDIVDLTSRTRPDGSLDWSPPKGRWIVLRFGYSLLGRLNHPAAPAATGLEVDKLNRGHIKKYIDAYLAEYEKAIGPEHLGKQGLQYLLTDSFEGGAQNWTDDMLDQFRRRRGYDALPWLPVLAGRVVESANASDRFLWDFRKTLGELIATEHYGQISESLHARGMGRYSEAHERFRAFIGDGMAVKKSADVPTGAMWAAPRPIFTTESSDADIRESASVAHIYGQNIAAAESFTAAGNPYGFAPETLKPIADRMMAMGLNRFAIHTSVHQPDNKPGPGIGLGGFGQWFTRKETWAEQAGAWLDYLSRSAYLLQQGRFVADVAYFYGEDTNITSLFNTGAPAIPSGYNFDFVNADALLNEMSVQDGRLTTRSGMTYRLLMLDASTNRMSVPVLRKLRDLVRAGAVVVGPKATSTPSLADDDKEFRSLVRELWGDAVGERVVGAGKVFIGRTCAEALSAMQVSPDFVFASPARFVHRMLGEGEIYFVSNATAEAQALDASFRIAGKVPELWHADTGGVSAVSYRIERDRTVVPLELAANDTVFVVFRRPAVRDSQVVPKPTREVLATLEGPWKLQFPPNLGAPAEARFDRLQSWTESVDAGVRYFSGTAAYSRTLNVPRHWLRARSRLQLDLGTVKNLAEVFVNGQSLGVLWKAPFTVDITDALRVGDNLLEIKVTNLWPNRLIGDKQPGAQKIAYATHDPFKADSPLLSSGLLGPVVVIASH
jgi:hypothetical protein